jgi:hypothetical protein
VDAVATRLARGGGRATTGQGYPIARKRETRTVVSVDGRSFALSNSDKVLIPGGGDAAGQGRAVTKLDLVEY